VILCACSRDFPAAAAAATCDHLGSINNNSAIRGGGSTHLMSHSSPISPDPSQPSPPAFAHLLIAADGPNAEFDEPARLFMGIPAMSNRDDTFFSGERRDTFLCA